MPILPSSSLSHGSPEKPNSIAKVSSEPLATVKLSRNAGAASVRLPRARESPRLRACSRQSSLASVETHPEIVQPIVEVLPGHIRVCEVEHSETELCLGALPYAHPSQLPPMQPNTDARSVRSHRPANSHAEILRPIDESLGGIQETSPAVCHPVSNSGAVESVSGRACLPYEEVRAVVAWPSTWEAPPA